MPDRWAVTQIREDAKGRIERYRCVKMNVNGQPYQGPGDFSRDQVAAAILDKQDFWTAFPDGHGGFRWGAPLEIALKTHPDASAADNLEKLPTF